ncbi:MAG: 3-oxoacyl-[acyl-carrier-protein] synthase III C-terminal domain-containing protein [bacterium]
MNIDNKNNVYIAGVHTILPELYPAEVVAEFVYPVEQAGELVNRLAKKALRSIGIKNRPFVRSEEKYPEKALAKDEYHPENWGRQMINHFLQYVKPEEVGFLGVSYNVTSHIDFLPNLACRIAEATGLNLDLPPEELPYLGCAASFFSLKSAIDYCSKNDKAAVVFNFDQCSWLCNPVMDPKHPEFTSSLKANLLFSDGAAGLLVVPESMKERFNSHLLKIIDLDTAYHCGAEIKMNQGRFLVGDKVKSVMPGLASNMILRPMLKRNNLTKEQITEWSVHQGGKPILESFKEDEILGLTDEQIQRSMHMFEEYGNFSSPSCLFILDSFFNEPKNGKNSDTLGAVIGFGAGYYLAAMLYSWE